MADSTTTFNVRDLLDPEIAEAVAAFPDLSSLSADTIGPMRDGVTAAPVELSDQVERVDHTVPGTDGVTVRVHRPVDRSGPLPTVVWMHGGGYVLGSRAMDDARFDRWCRLYPCIGVSVEYRLAPECPYPGPLDDCYAALRWAHDHADELGIDAARIGIGGPSAGGGLAAGLGLLARDRGEIDLLFQLLIYPMIDDRMTTTSSQWIDPVWPPGANRFGWSSYLGPLVDGDVPAYAAAARADDLTGLPPTLVAVGALDAFSDEDIAYAVRLRHAGVPTELHVYPGAPHGFDGIAPDAAVARRARRDIEEWLGAQLA